MVKKILFLLLVFNLSTFCEQQAEEELNPNEEITMEKESVGHHAHSKCPNEKCKCDSCECASPCKCGH